MVKKKSVWIFDRVYDALSKKRFGGWSLKGVKDKQKWYESEGYETKLKRPRKGVLQLFYREK